MHVTTPYLPSVAAHTKLDGTTLPKTVGSTWLFNYNGKLWPVVLCDDETAQRTFMNTKPSGYVFPAILLGKHIYIWVRDNGLRAFDPHKDYFEGTPQFEHDSIEDTDTKEDVLGKTRHKAFIEDALQFEGAAFWKNYIESKSAARKLEREMSAKHKRLADDDGVEVLRHGSRSSTSTSVTKKAKTQTGGGRPFHLLTPGPTQIKGEAGAVTESASKDSDDDDLFVSQQRRPSDPFVSGDLEDASAESAEDKLQRCREDNKRRIAESPPSDGTCTIFVGEKHTPFAVPREGLGKCDFLADRVQFNDKLKSHINLYEEIDIKDCDFIQIGEFLQKGEFAHKLIESKDGYQRLEGVVASEDKDRAAADIAKTYLAASKLRFGELQQLCVDKLRVLFPLSSDALLIVTMATNRCETWGCDAENEIKGWLVDHIVERYWQLTLHHAWAFARIMESNAELRQDVFAKMAESADASRRGLDELL